MINVLIADDNINYAIALMNYINEQNRNIRVCNITKDGEETLNVLNSETDIDVILLDYKMPFYNGTQILENLQNKDKYKDSCIIISGEITPKSVVSLRDNDLVHSIIFKSVSMSDINKRINKLIEDKETSKNEENIRQKIISELIYLGYDISHKGTQYLVSTLEYIVINNDSTDNLEKYVYPKIAKRYNDKPNNIKSRINNETNAMYYNCEVNRLKKYFHLDYDTKPKVKFVINMIINNMNKM